jgi:putative membrane protein (TIGR04086 family)
MSKQRSTAIAAGKGGLLSLSVYIGLQLLLALLAVRGILPEKRLFPAQLVTAAIASLAGGLYGGRRAAIGTLPSALLTTVCFAALAMLAGFLVYGGLAWSGETVARLSAMCIGGVLAGLVSSGNRKGKRKQRRKAGIRKK